MTDHSERVRASLAGRYTIERELGAGGMATVYLARDLKHDRVVALKVLRPDLAAVLGAERFLLEIRISAKLDHPHILTLIDSGTDDGFVWYVLPLVRGESLRGKLAREKQLRLEEALAITKQIASALSYAHGHGVIHRDIKPENILLHEGEAMLADFGIALAVKEAGGNRLTETGLSLGTPQYMSPEQAAGDRQLDARSDIYSLGAVLYEMLAGEPPFSGATTQAVIAKLLTERPTGLRVIRSGVPTGVDQAVARALEKSRADRFGSAAEFVEALSSGPPAGRTTWWRRLNRRVVAAAVLVAALGVAVTLAVAGLLKSPPAPFAQRQFTFTGRASGPALSPDGKMVAYIASNRSLLLQRLDGGDPIVLVPPVRGTFGSPRWSGDGSILLFQMMRDSVVEGRINVTRTWMIRSTGGSPREVLPDMSPFDAGPDSLTAVWAQRNPWRLEIVELSPFRVRTSISVPDSLGEILEVAWSPDRRWLAFAADGIRIVSAAGGQIRLIATSGENIRWAPSGDALYFQDASSGSNDLMKVGVDRRNGQARGTPTRVASLPTADGFSLARNGAVVHTQVAGSAHVLAMTLSGKPGGRIVETHTLTQGTSSIGAVAISADGGLVAYSRRAARRSRIEVVPFAGGPARPIGAGSGNQGAPSWSPNGAMLAYVNADSNGSRMMLMRYPDGTPQPLGSIVVGYPTGFGQGSWSADFAGSIQVSWSADGAWAAYPMPDLKRFNLVNPERQTESILVIPDSLGTGYVGESVSPDGRQFVVSTLRKWNDWGELRVTTVDGKGWQRLREPFGESAPLRWTSDGWLYLMNNRFLREQSGRWHNEIWRTKISGSAPQFMATLPDGCRYSNGPLISADGKRAVCVSVTTQSDLVVATGLVPVSR